MSTAIAERTSTYLDDFVARTPVEVRHIAQQAADALQSLLEYGTGDPDELWAAAERMRADAKKLADLGVAQSKDRAAATDGGWCGGSADAFDVLMADNDEQVRLLVASLNQVAEVLTAAHRAAADAVNLLLELIAGFAIAFVREAVVSVALGLLSGGLAVLAFAARWLTRLAATMTEGWRIVRRLGAIFGQLSRLLRDLAAKVADLRTQLQVLKKKMKTSGISWKEWGELKVKHAVLLAVPITAFNLISPVNLTGYAGAGSDAAVGAWDLISDGKRDRNYLMDDTYKDDLKFGSRLFQDLLDSLN
ncbi:hypothetical protein O7627_05325 [Solwaraspora sp. WMMD1047]|uniref:WXG100 family type VII secretion target n=1 Tax=Solwaraspora sp. WMMD1047 TaxID=3016102 RepID=UPI002416164F|nr:hypothetical protein [Solwaraspora sp. WMMD1047]MDG4828728.1 hypothetical protein [Solwaraspora sp. WMMD1047]